MTHLLDTTTFSALMRRDARVRSRIAGLPANDEIVICTVTRGEVLYGIARLPPGRRRNSLAAEAAHLFRQFPCLAIPEAAADRYAGVKRDAERHGVSLDENDLWIAATALCVGA